MSWNNVFSVAPDIRELVYSIKIDISASYYYWRIFFHFRLNFNGFFYDWTIVKIAKSEQKEKSFFLQIIVFSMSAVSIFHNLIIIIILSFKKCRFFGLKWNYWFQKLVSKLFGRSWMAHEAKSLPQISFRTTWTQSLDWTQSLEKSKLLSK